MNICTAVRCSTKRDDSDNEGAHFLFAFSREYKIARFKFFGVDSLVLRSWHSMAICYFQNALCRTCLVLRAAVQ